MKLGLLVLAVFIVGIQARTLFQQCPAEFDGDYIEIPRVHVGLNGKLSISAAVKQDKGNAGWIVYMSDEENGYWGLFSDGPRNRVHFQWNAMEDGEWETYSFRIDLGDYAIADGKWHSIALSFGERVIRFWKDGILGVSKIVDGPALVSPSSGYLDIANGGSHGYSYSGKIGLLELTSDDRGFDKYKARRYERYLERWTRSRCRGNQDYLYDYYEVEDDKHNLQKIDFGRVVNRATFDPDVKDIQKAMHVFGLKPVQNLKYPDPVMDLTEVKPSEEDDAVQKNLALPQSQSGPSSGVIAIIVVGCVVIVALAVGGIVAYSRRVNSKRIIYTELQ